DSAHPATGARTQIGRRVLHRATSSVLWRLPHLPRGFQMQFGMGQAVVRKEDLRLLTGGGRYLNDLNLPAQAHAAFLRSPHAHARVAAIDASVASRRPGVIAVLTGKELEADGIAPMPCLAHVPPKPGTPEQAFPRRTALATDRVRHVGDAVAMVVAESAAAARDALEYIVVDYAPLPAVPPP